MANIAITNYCNLKCPYCFADEFIQEDKKEITKEQLDDILSFLSKSPNVGRIGIIGGEPTTHSHFRTILKQFLNFSNINKIPLVIFSNGIYLEKVIPYLNKNFTCLLNLNEPNIIGESNWNKILFNLEQLKANGKIKFVNLGINLYPDIKDYEYILKAAKRYYKTNVRCSFVAPTCDYTHVNKDEYYKQAKIIFLDFMNKAKEYGVKVRLDCNHVPECYFSEEELEEFKKYIENWHPVCHPVVDITADMKATACFGSYDPVDINQFENLSELTEYLQNEKMCPLQEKNSSGNCSFCEKFKDKSCQGGCLAFAKYNN